MRRAYSQPPEPIQAPKQPLVATAWSEAEPAVAKRRSDVLLPRTKQESN